MDKSLNPSLLKAIPLLNDKCENYSLASSFLPVLAFFQQLNLKSYICFKPYSKDPAVFCRSLCAQKVKILRHKCYRNIGFSVNTTSLSYFVNCNL